MVNLDKIESIYFIGIGGIGMSALARYFHRMGKNVAGYDRVSKQLTNDLIAEGMDIHFVDSPNLIATPFHRKNTTLVVYTPAIPAKNRELLYFQQEGFPLLKRSGVLGLLSQKKATIAVAGTHGKTSVSTFASHLLNQTTTGCNAFLGGISKNFESNVLVNEKTERIVVEADEFDRSFHTLFPQLALVTAIEEDHLDIYESSQAIDESFQQFIDQIQPQGTLIKHIDVKLRPTSAKVQLFTYGVENPNADYFADNIRIREGNFIFDVVYPGGKWENFQLCLPGRINVENALAAIAIAHQSDVSEAEMRVGVRSFAGVKRRFDYQIRSNSLIYLDDYAHHPTEIESTLTSLREIYPNRTITGIFQPHLYSRTRDFAPEFGKALSLLDHAVVLDIYPAREAPVPGVSSELIYKDITIENKILLHQKDLLEFIKATNFDILITMGAGDIDSFVKPIKQLLENKI